MNNVQIAFSQGIIKGVLAGKCLSPAEIPRNHPGYNLGFAFGCQCYNQKLTGSYLRAVKHAGWLTQYYNLNLQYILEYAALSADASFIKYFLKGYFCQKGTQQ